MVLNILSRRAVFSFALIVTPPLFFCAALSGAFDDPRKRQAVPDKPVALIRLCAEYEAVNDLTAAINSCGLALMLDGVSIKDYAHFVQLLLSKPEPLGPKDVAAATNVINHLRNKSVFLHDFGLLLCSIH